MQLTSEQRSILDAASAGARLAIESGPGVGKTATLRALAEDRPHTSMCYLAFNKSIASEAESKFPSSVQCRTVHSYAYRAVGHRYRHRLNGDIPPISQRARALDLPTEVYLGGGVSVPAERIVRLADRAVEKFCASADTTPGDRHLPPMPEGCDPDTYRWVLGQAANRVWQDLSDPRSGRQRFTHAAYLKLFELSGPTLPGEVLLADEFQDTSPVIQSIIDQQRSAQLIAVGDSCQQLYEWRGAVDALARMTADERLPLSHSFRFGPAIAEVASQLLNVMPTELTVTGEGSVPSTVTYLPHPGAVLCRSNAGVVRAVSDAVDAGRKPHVVGGMKDVAAFAMAAKRLQAGQPAKHPELSGFGSWDDVREHAATEDGADIATMVRLVDRRGPRALLGVTSAVTRREADADVTVSTVHKAKGREWSSVRLAADFVCPWSADGKSVDLGEARTQYVAATRAMQALDVSALPWLH